MEILQQQLISFQINIIAGHPILHFQNLSLLLDVVLIFTVEKLLLQLQF